MIDDQYTIEDVKLLDQEMKLLHIKSSGLTLVILTLGSVAVFSFKSIIVTFSYSILMSILAMGGFARLPAYPSLFDTLIYLVSATCGFCYTHQMLSDQRRLISGQEPSVWTLGSAKRPAAY